MRVRWNKVVPAMIAVLMLLAACTPAATQAPAPAATQPPAAAATEAPAVDPMAELYAAAAAEGMLTTIALPHDWCNYEAVFEGFKAKYPGIEVNELDPGAGRRWIDDRGGRAIVGHRLGSTFTQRMPIPPQRVS